MKHGRPVLCAPALVCAALGLSAAIAEGPRPAYLGAARLFSQEEIIIVYPAAAGQDVATNRIAAERKAAHLESKWGVATEVVADDAITQEQLGMSLLLLGWGNRVIGTPQAPNPFSYSGEKRFFLGSILVRPDEDLLFAAVSPYNPDRWMFFWSRIDLERDRFLVMPFMGSDWVVYRDYAAVDQGMFADSGKWPPVRDPEAEKSSRQQADVPLQASSEHYVLHGVLDEEDARLILAAREAVLADVVRELGSPGDDFVIDLHVYRDSADKEERTGVPAGSHAIAGRREMHMTQEMARSSAPREEVSVVAAALFGPCSIAALYNGLATQIELPSGSDGLALYAAVLLEQGSMPRVEQLLDEEQMRVFVKGRVGLAASALLVGWLRETGGRELLARAYSSPRLDLARLAGWMGLSPSETEAAFSRWVAARAETAQAELAFRKEEEQAREQRLMGDRAAEAEALARALKHKPDHPETLYKLALALIESGQNKDAEKELLRLVGLSVGPEDTRYVIFGYYQLGRAYENLERTKKAGAAYRSMLELPDEYEAHRMAREALEKLSNPSGDE